MRETCFAFSNISASQRMRWNGFTERESWPHEPHGSGGRCVWHIIICIFVYDIRQDISKEREGELTSRTTRIWREMCMTHYYMYFRIWYSPRYLERERGRVDLTNHTDLAETRTLHDKVVLQNAPLCHDSFEWVTWLAHQCAMICSDEDTARQLCCANCATVPCLIQMCDMTHSHVCHEMQRWGHYTTRLVFGMGNCAMTHSYLLDDFLVHVSQITETRAMRDKVVVAEYTSAPWLIRICHMIRSYVCNDCCAGCTTAPWLIRICDMTRSWVYHDSHSYLWHYWFISVLWLFCRMHNSFVIVTWLVHTFTTTSIRKRVTRKRDIKKKAIRKGVTRKRVTRKRVIRKRVIRKRAIRKPPDPISQVCSLTGK